MFKEDLTGMQFGLLTVLEYIGTNKYRASLWRCVCSCNGINEIIVSTSHLKSGDVQSCGCLIRTNHYKIHGECDTRLYDIWNGMKKRCNNPNSDRYNDYGGRGITVCDDWNNNYINFRDWSLNNGYDDNLTIDRIDNDLGYSPDNCRWATRLEQQNNTRSNAYYEFNNETHSLTEWCRILNLNYNTIKSRLRNGWTFEQAITTPILS